MFNFKEKLIADLSKNEKIIEISIIYDCAALFKIVEKIEDLQKKKDVTKIFSSFLWAKYIMDKDNSRPGNNLVDLVSTEEVGELLMDTANLFSFIADKEENKAMINHYRENVLKFLNGYGKNP